MAEALGWGLAERPSPTVTGGGTETGGAEPIAKLLRQHARKTIDGTAGRDRDDHGDGAFRVIRGLRERRKKKKTRGEESSQPFMKLTHTNLQV